MKIELNEKKYIAPSAKAKLFRKALVITKEYDLNNITPDTLDELLFYVCEVFNNQFTIEDIYENVESKNLISLVTDSIEHVVGEPSQDVDKKN